MMKTSKNITTVKIMILLCLILGLTGCFNMSETEKDSTAGINGGFEITKNGLPVNWLMYTSNTVPDSQFKISFDNEEFKEGKHSLRFDVDQCYSTGGRYSPGFTNEFFEIAHKNGFENCKLSFWLKNKGAKYRISAGGVSSFKGNMKILIESDASLPKWKYFEYQIEIPKDMHFRMEFNILEPGAVWIDDVKIES